jgi:hypothetical protein
MEVYSQGKQQLNLLEDGDIMLKRSKIKKQKFYFQLETSGEELLPPVEVPMIR